uniref:DNA topoisomerase (ATP-hydrolyzing) n=1 Tax=viral metagenome TaxID=1070528 RepID=A0A6C0BDG6_9ZZZZ
MDNFLVQDPNSEYGIVYDPNQEKILKDINDASRYGYIPEVPRVFLRSHVYGGSHVREERNVLLYDIKEKYFIRKKITTPKLEERLLLEMLSNCIDNAFLSRRMNVDPGDVTIDMTSDTISIRNTGIPIPVDIHEYFYSQNQFGTCAELIFGIIGAGSNTDDRVTKQGGGQNGIGSKLCNIFSREFTVEIGDNIRGFHQKVIWRRNMTKKVSSVITPSTYNIVMGQDRKYHIVPIGDRYNGPNFVKITWKQDFRKFGIDYFSQEELELYMKYAADATFQGKIPIVFNNTTIDCRGAQSYANLFPKEMSKTAFIHYEFSQAPPIQGRELEAAIASFQIVPDVELIVLDSPGEGMHISYCNGIYNVDGGVHTDAAYREVLRAVKEVMASNKGFDKGLDMSKLDIRDIKKHCTIIINYKCKEPVFKGQDKERLNKPEPKINISPDESAKMKKWKLVDILYKSLTGKNLTAISGGRLGRGRVKDDENFEDANWVDTPRRNEAVMVICEGKSAGAYILKWILSTPERKDKYAAFLLKGKVKNVTDLGVMEIESNEELRKLIKYMGLEYGVDYRTKEGAASLRYGYIYVMVDADSDGSHILCLFLNFIYRAFPTFAMAGRIFYPPTPVIRVLTSSGQTKEIFYNMFQYNQWNEKNGFQKHTAKYFKGLAAGKDAFAKEDSKISPLVLFGFDQLACQALDIAFKRGLTNERKKWIQFWRDKIDTEVVTKIQCQNPRLWHVNISDYINTKLVEYSIDSFTRALPGYKDGLKKSQRQVLWYILDEWNFGHSRKSETKLSQIASAAANKCKYHHGDKGLIDVLSRMASFYPGSNNCPLMSPEGQFGTRNKLGADVGAARYVETKPEPFFTYIFDEELLNLVEQNVVEDKKVEPKWIPCKVPLHIINGVVGVATAYSLEIPSYHPVDVIVWILQYISEQMVFPMVPWFRGFTGGIELEIFKGKYKKESSQQLTEEMIHYYEGLTLTTTGIFRHIRNRNQEYTEEINGKKTKVVHEVADVYVTEVPIGVGLASYRSAMEKLCDRIDDKMETTDTPNIIIEGWKKPITHKDLLLIERTGLCNITLIDDDSFPIQMRNIYEALKIYCDNMIDLYLKLKEKRLKELEEGILHESKIIKLIELLLTDTIIAKKQNESYVAEQLKPYGIEYEIYKKLSRRSETIEGYQEHLEKLTTLQKRYELIRNKHHLAEWSADLNKFMNELTKDPSYQKLQHHQYPFVPTNINDLLSGKIKSPYKIKEETLPQSI